MFVDGTSCLKGDVWTTLVRILNARGQKGGERDILPEVTYKAEVQDRI